MSTLTKCVISGKSIYKMEGDNNTFPRVDVRIDEKKRIQTALDKT